jgi:hypothetical protein
MHCDVWQPLFEQKARIQPTRFLTLADNSTATLAFSILVKEFRGDWLFLAEVRTCSCASAAFRRHSAKEIQPSFKSFFAVEADRASGRATASNVFKFFYCHT